MPDEVDLPTASARVEKIMQASKPEPTPLLNAIGPTRKTRSDAGKPRETFYVSIPGVRFDMTNSVGRDAFSDWLQSQLLLAPSLTKDSLSLVFLELVREIDRLRK